MAFEKKEALLFDLDGTLVDSAPDLALALNHTLGRMGREPFAAETIRSWVGNGAPTLLKRGLSGSSVVNEDLDAAEVARGLEIFLEYYGRHLCVDTRAYPGVSETLRALKARGYRLALVTNKPYAFIAPLLEGLNLSGLFERCLGGDSLPRRKPDPMPLLHTAAELGVEVDACLMVGDSKNDILAARAAGMESIGVTYGYNYGEAIEAYGPERIAEEFSQILAYLE